MNLSELIHTIKSKNFLFEIIAEGLPSFGKHTVTHIEMIHGNLENYFNQIAKVNRLTTLSVQLYAKNGSSFLRKGFFVVDIPAVVDSTTNQQQINKSVDGINEHQQQINKVVEEKPYTPTEKNNTMNITKDTVDLVQVKTENKYLAERCEELKQRNKELERKNDEYYTENLKLIREKAVEKDKLELEYRKKELELAADKKSGLNGIVDEVKNLPPEAWNFIGGFFPNHPAAKGLLQSGGQNSSESQLNGTKHSDPDAQSCIEVITDLLLKEKSEVVGMLALINEHLIKTPAHLKAVYDKFFPEKPNTEQTN